MTALETVIRDNPYIIGRPIREPGAFYGREDLFQFIGSNLRSGAQVILLGGQRRIGKSSVLYQIPHQLDGLGFAFVRFDLQSQTGRRLSRVLAKLAQEITTQLQLADQVTPPATATLETDPDAFAEDFLPQVDRALGERRLALLLDEFDVLSNGGQTTGNEPAVDPFFVYLRDAVSQDERLHIIAVIGRQLADVPALRSLFREAPFRRIGRLDQPHEATQAEQLIVKPAEGMLTYQPDAIEAIFDLTAKHPLFMQLLCFTVFARAQEAGRTTVTRADVEASVDEAIESGEGALQWFRDGLPLIERVVFSAVAEARAGSPWTLLEERGAVLTPDFQPALTQLVEWDFVTPAIEVQTPPPQLGETFAPRVTVELVRRWLVRRYPLRRELAELERLDNKARDRVAEASAMLQRGERAEALARYEHALALNPNHFTALQVAAELALDTGQVEQAVTLYERAYRYAPARTKDEYARALLLHGQALVQQRQPERARPVFARVLALEPANQPSRTQLAALNPFVVGRPALPDEFVGRTREVRILFSLILARGHVAISGERRIGKTSLLQFVATPETWQAHGADPTRVIILYIDCAAIQPFSPISFWRAVLAQLSQQASEDTALAARAAEANPGETDWQYILVSLLELFAVHQCFLVLLLDEFEVALQPHPEYSETDILSFLYSLRSLRYEPYLTLVVATRLRLSDLGPRSVPDPSPWYDSFSLLPIKPFIDEDFHVLMAKMPSIFHLDDVQRAWVREIAGTYPFFLQAALAMLYRLHADDESFDVSRMTQEFARSVDTFCRDLWELASEAEQVTLVLVALGGLASRVGMVVLDAAWLAEMLGRCEIEARALVERGLLIDSGPADGDRYTLAAGMLEWWILRELEATRRVEELIERADRVLSLPLDAAGGLVDDEVEELRPVLEQLRQHRFASAMVERWGQPRAGRATPA